MVDNPITRKEKYLAKLTGSYTGNVPDPITRVEKYLYDLCQKGISGLTPEEIENAVNKYLKENPVQPGATEEQAQQIKKNADDVALLKEDLSNKITKFYASSQGEAHLADSDNGKIMDMMLYGKSEQFTTIGKNLLKIKDGTQKSRGVTITAKDGVVALKGTATESGWAVFTVDSFVLDGTYILSSNITANIRVLVANKSFKTVLEQGKSATLENVEASKVCFTITEGETYDISNILIQIEKGSVATSCEPYTGGIPSPNPSYPQEIKSVVNPTVKVCGKNLIQPLMPTTTVGGVTVTNNGDGTYTLNGTATANITFRIDQSSYTGRDNLKKYKGTYTFSRSDTSYEARIQQQDTWLVAMYLNIGLQSVTKEINFDNCFVFISASKGTTYNNVLVDLQIESGSTATPFEPYHEQTVTIPYTLNAIPVSSGGNVTIDGQQYIADYVDVERGKLVRMCKEYVITGSERLAMYWLGNASYLRNVCCINNFENIVLYDGINPLAMSDMFIGKISKNADDERAIYLMLRGSGDKTLAIKFLDSDGITTVDLAKQWLIEHKPKTVFVLSTPEEIDLTSEEVQAFKALATYYPITNISINSEQLDGYTVLNYPISMENGWNYVKQQIGDTRDYIYDMDARTQDTDLQAAEAYVNSEYAVALTELEV